jgi:hypothetical protein
MVEVLARSRAQAPLRLTRRGRAVLLAFLLLLLAGLAGLAAPPGLAATPTGAADRAAAPIAVVGPADTLWSIAQRYTPERDPFDSIDEIRRLNRISGYTVHPGQRLVLPRHP